MEEGRSFERPGEEVSPAGEVIMLVRLVDGDGESELPEVARLELAHHRVDRIFVIRRTGRASPPEPEVDP